MTIRLIEIKQTPILLSNHRELDERIELFEDNIFEFLRKDSGYSTLRNKVELLSTLATMYQEAGYKEAAIAALKRLEPFYFEYIENLSIPIEDNKFDLLVSGYLSCGCVEDATRVAKLTSEVFGRALSATEEQSASVTRWLTEQFEQEIDAFKSRREEKAVKMRHLRVCADVCAVDDSFIIKLRERDNRPKGA